jgi:hypothetical protein
MIAGKAADKIAAAAPNDKTCGNRVSSPSLFLRETRNSNHGRTAILSKPLHTILDFSAHIYYYHHNLYILFSKEETWS